MPLHDWTQEKGWSGVHHFWISRLVFWLKPRLPPEYRAYVGTAPTLAVGAADEQQPDVSVRRWLPEKPAGPEVQGDAILDQPDAEAAVSLLTEDPAVFVAREGHLVAAVELISPRNKDRNDSRAKYLARYLSYLQEGVHLLLVDVFPRPRNFSFADALAQHLQIKIPATPPPLALTYRVGEPAPEGGRLLAWWRRPLQAGSPLPAMPLPLTAQAAVSVDLETTYMQAATDAYVA